MALHIGVLSLELHISDAQSLKSKRWVLKSMKDRLRSQFNISVAELDGMDKWQRTTLAVCAIGSDKRRLDGALQGALALVEKIRDIQILDHHTEFL